MKNWSKASSEPVTLRMSIRAIVGRSSGNVILVKICHRFAPSDLAAS